MDLPLAREALDLSRRRRRWLLLASVAAGVTGYGAYKLYHLPAVVEKRRRLAKLLRAISSLVESFSASAETVGIVSDDLNRFLRSDSDELPPSLRQLSKIAASDEFATSVSRVSGALTTGVMRGVATAESDSGGKPKPDAGSSVPERLLDKLFSTAGSRFASVVVSSFARNLVTAFYDAQGGTSTAAGSETPPVPEWVRLVCGDEFRRLIGDCVQLFVGTAVAVYLEKTMDLNTFDDMFSGLTNPKHETKVKDMLVTVCNGAVETLVKTSHQVLTNPGPSSTPSTDRDGDIEVDEEPPSKHKGKGSFDAGVKVNSTGWVDMVSSTLAVPSNRSFVLDLTGRVTSETVRSFLDFMLWNLFNGAKRGVKVVRGEAVERGLEVVRYVTAKSIISATVCLALCLHLLSETRFFVPANSFSPKQGFSP